MSNPSTTVSCVRVGAVAGLLAPFACATVSLLLYGQALAQTAAQSDTSASTVTAATAPAVRYRIINLVPGALTQTPSINASGQVAMSVVDGTAYQSWFFDGKRLHAIAQPGWPGADVTGLNDKGQIAGFSHVQYDFRRAFRWSLASGFDQIGLDGEASQASAINRDGVVVFDAARALDPPRALRWTAAGGREELGALDRWGSAPVALNDDGVVTGFSDTASLDAHAFLWTRAGGMRDLGTLGGPASYPSAINAAGQVTGYSLAGSDGLHYRAFLASAANPMRDLGALGGTDSFGQAINKMGQIIGTYNLADDVQRGFSWTARGGMADIGTLGGTNARPIAINGAGQVTGFSWNKAEDSRAFLWSAAAGMADLNTRLVNAPAGLVLDTGVALSDTGSIVAFSNAGLVLLRPLGQAVHPAPVVGPIELPALVKPGSAAAVRVAFNDSDSNDLHHVDWQWGDLSLETALVTEKGGAGSARGVHVYREAGIYTVVARVTDRAGNTTVVKREVVVADPARNPTLGSGRVDSPRGALRADPAHSGPASFSLVAPAAGKPAIASTPTGLRFAAGKSVFNSTSMLRASALTGAPAAQRYTGVGQFNGKGGYQYSLTLTPAPVAAQGAAAAAVAGQTAGGQFGLRIWHTDPATHTAVVDYDNQRAGTAGGARVIEGALAMAP